MISSRILFIGVAAGLLCLLPNSCASPISNESLSPKRRRWLQSIHTHDNEHSRLEVRRRQQFKRSPSKLAFVDPTSSVLDTLSTIAKNNPYGSAFAVAAFKGSLADIVAQRSESVSAKSSVDVKGEDSLNKSHDYRRTLVFLLYGGLYQGISLNYFYNNLFDILFGDSVLAKLAFNQLILTPFVTLPVAYLAKGIVFGKSLRFVMEEYWQDVTKNGLLTAFWKLWTPVNFLMFSVVPPHFRVAFSALVSFVWTIILSRISNAAR